MLKVQKNLPGVSIKINRCDFLVLRGPFQKFDKYLNDFSTLFFSFKSTQNFPPSSISQQ
jgi:hypothetical protein